jgi:hypothetical protein
MTLSSTHTTVVGLVGFALFIRNRPNICVPRPLQIITAVTQYNQNHTTFWLPQSHDHPAISHHQCRWQSNLMETNEEQRHDNRTTPNNVRDTTFRASANRKLATLQTAPSDSNLGPWWEHVSTWLRTSLAFQTLSTALLMNTNCLLWAHRRHGIDWTRGPLRVCWAPAPHNRLSEEACGRQCVSVSLPTFTKGALTAEHGLVKFHLMCTQVLRWPNHEVWDRWDI